ncbi:Predicted Zn-dependent protease or its inactivated homolog [Jatrophihabitans endophyticus]|uniref:Predicted Zn-dependent protease or its inactivated homolog n=1 Tax=Jatrophihabitans endophyticus TaxID=1206085 RepID=A0A1M5I942_9ACTN|nr:metallopeptidase TldD-related protein [Jatrophihabitans endophyticus]SHG24745.1 Predicted Zn-dependent protease or its inactivated homolog [Jatrophihabitans endophyticus]
MTAPQELVEAALAACTADGCVVLAADHSETNLRWAANALTTNGEMRSRSLTVVATVDKAGGTSAGVVTRAVTTVDDVTELVHAAELAARDAEPADDAAPLVDPYRHDDDWDADPAETSVAVFEPFAAALGRVLPSWRAADRLLYGFAEHELTSYFLATSTGLRRRFDQPSGRLELNGKTADLTGSTWSGRYTNDFLDIDVETATAELEQRLQWGRRRLDLDPGRYETLLPPTSVADLMIYAYWSASARDAEEGRSAFAGPAGQSRLGERLTELPLRLHSDPSAPGLGCAPFEIATSSSAGLQSVFDNGHPLGATSWLDGGVLGELIRTRAWATRTGTEPRPVIDNLLLESADGTASLEDMVARTERGLLVTSMWYIREVDPQNLLLTGLTRDGVFLVEDGEVRGAVNNFRWNESPLDLLRRTSEVGATVPTLSREWSDYFRRTAMPPLRIPDFNMSTVSPAS